MAFTMAARDPGLPATFQSGRHVLAQVLDVGLLFGPRGLGDGVGELWRDGKRVMRAGSRLWTSR